MRFPAISKVRAQYEVKRNNLANPDLANLPPSENNVQEELFDQILRGKLEFPSPDWDTISLPAKVL